MGGVTLRLEVALIESDPDRGVRILGRTTDAALVASVRGHLVERLNQPPENQQESTALTLVPRLDPDGSLDRDPRKPTICCCADT